MPDPNAQNMYGVELLGAAGYLFKGMFRTELIQTIRSVHAGHRRIPPEIASQIAEHFSAEALSSREI